MLIVVNARDLQDDLRMLEADLEKIEVLRRPEEGILAEPGIVDDEFTKRVRPMSWFSHHDGDLRLMRRSRW